MTKPKEEIISCPLALPIVRDGQANYFADLRLGEFRPVNGPLELIAFDSDKGRRLCSINGVFKCPNCGMSVIIGRPADIEKLRCMRCFNLLVPLLDV